MTIHDRHPRIINYLIPAIALLVLLLIVGIASCQPVRKYTDPMQGVKDTLQMDSTGLHKLHRP